MTKEKFLLSILYVAFLLMGQTKGFCQTSCTADQWQTVVASTEDDYADFPCDTVITRTCGHSIIVTAEAGGTGRGRVEGGGEYYEGDTATLTVLPWTLWGFLRWADGDTTNPRRVVVTQDTTLTAIFVSREAIEAALEGDAGFSPDAQSRMGQRKLCASRRRAGRRHTDGGGRPRTGCAGRRS
ncbi:MAG: hypothetical protein IKG81_12650 [Bacteroidales bacterium]|nr:hypothetical protein [Bacteroidales bacterium]